MPRPLREIVLTVLAASLLLNLYLLYRPGVGLVATNAPATAITPHDVETGTGVPATVASPGPGDRALAPPVPATTITADRQAINNELLLAVERMTALFQRGRYVQAVADYALLLSRDTEAADEVKLSWRQSAWQWLERGEHDRVRAFTAAFLHQYPFDRDIRLLKAGNLAAEKETVAAVWLYYDLVRDTRNPALRSDDQAMARQLALQYAEGLRETGAWAPLVEFCRRLLWQDPYFVPYSLLLARAEIAQEDFSAARNTLRAFAGDNFYGTQVAELLTYIDIAKLKQVAIPLAISGEHYIVSGIVNDKHNVRLMIDTGASLSVLSRAVFEKLAAQTNTQFVGDTTVNTAGGQVVAGVYRLDKFAVGDYFVRDIRFVVLELENLLAGDGLLGMNFLKHFTFNIDQQNNLLLLSPNGLPPD